MSRQPHGETSTIPGYLRIRPEGLLLAVKVQPRARANAIDAPLGDELRVRE